MAELAAIEVSTQDEHDILYWSDWIKTAQSADPAVTSLVLEQPAAYVKRAGLIRQVMEHDSDRVVIPDAIAWELVSKVHRYLLHFGTDKVLDFIQDYFAINNVDRLVRDVVASCEVCIASKIYTRPTVGAQYYDQPLNTGEVVSIDIYGPLPKSHKGFKYVLVLLDQFSKHTALIPMWNQKVETITKLIRERYFPRKGYIPKSFLTDNGGQFITRKWKDFGTRNNVNLKRTTPYNPQANPVERVMRELGRVLRVYAHHDHENWDQILPRMESVLNHTAHSSTGYPPVSLEFDYRWYSQSALNPLEKMEVPRALLPRHRLQVPISGRNHLRDPETPASRTSKRRLSRENLRKAAQKRKIQANKKEISTGYKPGDIVWRKNQRRSDALHRKTRKLFLLYEGPFVVEACPHPNAYALRRLDGRDAGVSNARQLRPHRTPELQPTVIVEDSDPATLSSASPTWEAPEIATFTVETEGDTGDGKLNNSAGNWSPLERTTQHISLEQYMISKKLTDSNAGLRTVFESPERFEIESYINKGLNSHKPRRKKHAEACLAFALATKKLLKCRYDAMASSSGQNLAEPDPQSCSLPASENAELYDTDRDSLVFDPQNMDQSTKELHEWEHRRRRAWRKMMSLRERYAQRMKKVQTQTLEWEKMNAEMEKLLDDLDKSDPNIDHPWTGKQKTTPAHPPKKTESAAPSSSKPGPSKPTLPAKRQSGSDFELTYSSEEESSSLQKPARAVRFSDPKDPIHRKKDALTGRFLPRSPTKKPKTAITKKDDKKTLPKRPPKHRPLATSTPGPTVTSDIRLDKVFGPSTMDIEDPKRPSKTLDPKRPSKTANPKTSPNTKKTPTVSTQPSASTAADIPLMPTTQTVGIDEQLDTMCGDAIVISSSSQSQELSLRGATTLQEATMQEATLHEAHQQAPVTASPTRPESPSIFGGLSRPIARSPNYVSRGAVVHPVFRMQDPKMASESPVTTEPSSGPSTSRDTTAATMIPKGLLQQLMANFKDEQQSRSFLAMIHTPLQSFTTRGPLVEAVYSDASDDWKKTTMGGPPDK